MKRNRRTESQPQLSDPNRASTSLYQWKKDTQNALVATKSILPSR